MVASMSEEDLREELLESWRLLDKRTATGALRTVPLALAIDGRHLAAAVDKAKARHVLIPVPDGQNQRGLWRSASVTLARVNLRGEDRRNQTWLDLHCRRPELEPVFVRLAVAVLTGLDGRTPDQLEGATIAALEDWKDLLGRGGAAEEPVTGLLAELLILEHLVAIDPVRALDIWQGPGGGRHDFRCGAHAIEVKGTTRRVGRQVQIHGVEQLLPPDDGDLHLAYLRLEHVPGGSLSVAAVTRQLIAAGVTRDILLENLAVRDIPDLECDGAKLSFELRETIWYRVDDTFPRIIPTSFVAGQLPTGVLGIAYDVDLTAVPPIPDTVASGIIPTLMR